MAIENLSGGTALSTTLVASAASGRGVARTVAPGERGGYTAVATALASEQQEPRTRRHDDVEAPSAKAEPERTKPQSAESPLVSDSMRLSILYDRDIDVFVSRSVEEDTGEVVRQFPYETQIERIRHFVKELQEGKVNQLDVSA